MRRLSLAISVALFASPVFAEHPLDMLGGAVQMMDAYAAYDTLAGAFEFAPQVVVRVAADGAPDGDNVDAILALIALRHVQAGAPLLNGQFVDNLLAEYGLGANHPDTPFLRGKLAALVDNPVFYLLVNQHEAATGVRCVADAHLATVHAWQTAVDGVLGAGRGLELAQFISEFVQNVKQSGLALYPPDGSGFYALAAQTQRSVDALTPSATAPKGIQITTHPTGVTINAGQTAAFTVAATGVSAYAWEVSTDGGATWNPVTQTTPADQQITKIWYNGAVDAATLTLTEVPTTCSYLPNGYQYRAVVTDPCGGPALTSNPATLTINPNTYYTNYNEVTFVDGLGNTITWMDRNLGAAQVATAFNDTQSYGDLYQWGRLSDGHQCRTSTTTATLGTALQPLHNQFILTSAAPNDWYDDQDGVPTTTDNTRWQGTGGPNNPCPAGFRLPTRTEWTNFAQGIVNASLPTNYNGAFATSLKLTVGGYRSRVDGNILQVADIGSYQSSTPAGTNVRNFSTSNAALNPSSTVNRSGGAMLRCIKN